MVICGAIAGYNDKVTPPGPRNYLSLLIRRGRTEGFLVLDYLDRAAELLGHAAEIELGPAARADALDAHAIGGYIIPEREVVPHIPVALHPQIHLVTRGAQP